VIKTILIFSAHMLPVLFRKIYCHVPKIQTKYHGKGVCTLKEVFSTILWRRGRAGLLVVMKAEEKRGSNNYRLLLPLLSGSNLVELISHSSEQPLGTELPL